MENEETDVTTDSSTVTDDSTQNDSSQTDHNQDQTVDSSSTGSETDTNTDAGKDKTVPYDRFHEVNEAKRQAEERARELEAELEAAKAAKEEPASDDVDIEEDTEKLLDAYAKKKGLVSQVDIQLKQDIQDLKTEYAKTGVPFDDKSIYDYAKKNDLPVPQSKAAWRALYRDLNHEAIVEAERKRAVVEYREGTNSSAEKPGPGGAKAPTESKLPTRKERIHAAANRIFGTT